LRSAVVAASSRADGGPPCREHLLLLPGALEPGLGVRRLAPAPLDLLLGLRQPRREG
jgi:hypothetical protein